MSLVVEGLVRFPATSEDVIDRFCAEFAEVELPVLRSSGLDLAAAWVMPGETTTDLVHLYGPVNGLADLTASAARIAELPEDHAYLGLYQWITDAGISYSRTVRRLVDPVDRAWWQRNAAREAAGAQFAVATCRYGLTGQDAFRPALTAAIHDTESDAGTSVAMAYDTLFGEFGSTRVMGTSRSVADFADAVTRRTAGAAQARTPWVTVEAAPTAYSPIR